MQQLDLLEEHITTSILPVKVRLVQQLLGANGQLPVSPGQPTTANDDDEAPDGDPELRLSLTLSPGTSSSQSGQGEGFTSRDSSSSSEMGDLADTDAGAGGKLGGDDDTGDAEEGSTRHTTYSHSSEKVDEDDETCSVGLELGDEMFGVSSILGGAGGGGCAGGSDRDVRGADSVGGTRWSSSSGGVGSSDVVSSRFPQQHHHRRDHCDFLGQLEAEGVFAATDSYSPNENLTGFSRDFLALPTSPVHQEKARDGNDVELYGPAPILTLASFDEEGGGGGHSELRSSPPSCSLVKEEPCEVGLSKAPAFLSPPPPSKQQSCRVASSSSVLDDRATAADSATPRTDGDGGSAAAGLAAATESSNYNDSMDDSIDVGSGSCPPCGGASQTASLHVASWPQNATCCSPQNDGLSQPASGCCSETCSSRPVSPRTPPPSSLHPADTQLSSAPPTMPATEPGQPKAQPDTAQQPSAVLAGSSLAAPAAPPAGFGGTVKTPTSGATPGANGGTVAATAATAAALSRTEVMTGAGQAAAAAAGAPSLSSGIASARMTLGPPPRPAKRRRSSSLSSALLQPREVHYQCVACGKIYSAIVAGNPWWALVRQQCPVCHKMQIPRVDILNPSNNVEGHVSLLTEACAEVSYKKKNDGVIFGVFCCRTYSVYVHVLCVMYLMS